MDIDVSKVVTTTQEIDPDTNELVTKVTGVGPGVKDKTVGQELSRVPVQEPEKSDLEKRFDALESTLIEKEVFTKAELDSKSIG